MRVTNPATGSIWFSKRRHRFDAENTPRELTFSCYRGYPFFIRDRARNWFVEALQDARRTWPVDLWAWVLMPEHVHLIVMPRAKDVPIGEYQGKIKERVARRAIQWLERHAPQWIPKITVREGSRLRRRFWQPGGGYDRNIDKVETLEAMIEYLHLNPVRRGLVETAVDWKWSSARWYAGVRSVPIEMDAMRASV
jgi:putative transposase